MLIFNLAYRRFIWAILSAGPLADLGKTFWAGGGDITPPNGRLCTSSSRNCPPMTYLPQPWQSTNSHLMTDPANVVLSPQCLVPLHLSPSFSLYGHPLKMSL